MAKPSSTAPASCQGILDSPLTRQGIAQAKSLGQALKGQGIERIVASPLGRSQQTAALIAEEIGFPAIEIETDSVLREITLGVWNGLTRAEFKERYPEDWRAREADKWHVPPPGGESYADLRARLKPWLFAHHGDPHLLAVAHGAVNRVLRGLYLDLAAYEILTLDEPQGVYFRFVDGAISRHPDNQ